jgi:hypothetical protein
MKALLKRMLDPAAFLSDYGVRSLSRYHAEHPCQLQVPLLGRLLTVDYEPAESRSRLFGGNSNWRGPIWFPVNFLIIESLQKFHYYYGDDFKVECPTGFTTITISKSPRNDAPPGWHLLRMGRGVRSVDALYPSSNTTRLCRLHSVLRVFRRTTTWNRNFHQTVDGVIAKLLSPPDKHRLKYLERVPD